MVVGKPPFHGENHIDLLRNIQQKAVRLPPDLKVSGELVKLLRLLLNRNPLSRAGFKDFIAASDAFVNLGCNGSPTTVVSKSSNLSDTSIITTQPQLGLQNLGPISEVEESTLNEKQVPQPTEENMNIIPTTQPMFVPTSPNLYPPFHGVSQVENGNAIQQPIQKAINSHFVPLEPSPPGPKQFGISDRLPSPFNLKSVQEWQNCNQYVTRTHQIQRNKGESTRMLHSVNNSHSDQHQSSRNIHPSTAYKKEESSQNSDDSCGGSGFVMVEKGSANINATTSPISFLPSDEKTISTTVNMWKKPALNVVPASVLSGNSTKVSPPISPRSKYFNALSSRNLIPPAIPFLKKGMLSTSPGAGGALVGLMGNSKDIHPLSTDVGHMKQNETIYLDKATKILSAADDVGRRAINVAHVGDVRAYLAMRLIISNENTSLQTTFDPMESVEEESQDKTPSVDDSSPSTRVRTISVDLSIQRRNSNCSIDNEDEEDDEMPFAMPLEEHNGSPLSNLLAVRALDNSEDDVRSNYSEVKHISTSASILAHFREALSCYIKTLSMLRSSVNACQQILSQLEVQNGGDRDSFNQFKTRCEVSYRWLSGQFKGVLERADAANSEISKITKDSNNSKESLFESHALSVEELVYNHSLACGKDGAIKQLLGQYETARSCYRSAGLLAETLLMDPKLVKEDKIILEDYVQGFSDRIYEIDYIMLQQNRQSTASSISSRGAVMESIHHGRNTKASLVLGENK